MKLRATFYGGNVRIDLVHSLYLERMSHERSQADNDAIDALMRRWTSPTFDDEDGVPGHSIEIEFDTDAGTATVVEVDR